MYIYICIYVQSHIFTQDYRCTVAKLNIATGHAMQIYNCLNCPRQL